MRPKGKTPPQDLRRTLSAIVWRHTNGTRWRSVPPHLGPWWRVERDTVRDCLGHSAPGEAEERASDALGEIEAAILAMAPATFAGPAAKARWASWDGLSKPTAAIWAKRVTADVVAMAERGGAAS